MKIKLEDYKSKDSKVFAGKERGIEVRKEMNLDELDYSPNIVSIEIPKDTFTINSSFFLGLFGTSIEKLKEDKFREHYDFINYDLFHEDIDDGIKRALKEKFLFNS
jgi:hypothetical protein